MLATVVLPRWGAVAAVVLALVLAPSASADRLTVAVSNRPATRTASRAPVAPIAPRFVGASMDYCAITDYTEASAHPVLARLLLNLARSGPLIRIGGDGPDASCLPGPRSITVAPDAIAALAQRTGAKLILGIDLMTHSVHRVGGEVAALEDAIDRRGPPRYIKAFEIGNEPDLYPEYGPMVAPAQSGPYFSSYLGDFTQWAHVIRIAARDPTVGIAGPSLGRSGLPWLTGSNVGDFAAFLNAPARPRLITFHSYPLVWSIQCPAIGCPSIPSLLLNSSSQGLAEQLAPLVGRLGHGRELRVDEMNSVTGGGVAGVSNTFASALWVLDTLFEFARAGVSGVNVHTFSSAQYALFSGPNPGGWRVHPEYYGLLAFANAAPAGAQLLAVSAGQAKRAAPAVKVWATRGLDGRARILIINKDVVAHDVVLQGSGVPRKATATLARLLASPTPGDAACPADYVPTGLCATGGVTFGGRTFGSEDLQLGGDWTSTGALGPRLRGTCVRIVACVRQDPGPAITVAMPPGSAALLTGSLPTNVWSTRRTGASRSRG